MPVSILNRVGLFIAVATCFGLFGCDTESTGTTIKIDGGGGALQCVDGIDNDNDGRIDGEDQAVLNPG